MKMVCGLVLDFVCLFVCFLFVCFCFFANSVSKEEKDVS